MKLAILCLCLASTASAVPYEYLPRYTVPRQQAQPTQVKNPFGMGVHPGLQGGYSVEFIYPHRIPGGAAGFNPAEPLPRYGFLKHSIPQPPGRQSVEIFYPYDFIEQRIIPNIPPMSNGPVSRDVLPFGYPSQNVPQQNTNVFPFGYRPQSIPQQNTNTQMFNANPHPSQDPVKPLQQDLPTQTSQVPATM